MGHCQWHTAPRATTTQVAVRPWRNNPHMRGAAGIEGSSGIAYITQCVLNYGLYGGASGIEGSSEIAYRMSLCPVMRAHATQTSCLHVCTSTCWNPTGACCTEGTARQLHVPSVKCVCLPSHPPHPRLPPCLHPPPHAAGNSTCECQVHGRRGT